MVINGDKKTGFNYELQTGFVLLNNVYKLSALLIISS